MCICETISINNNYTQCMQENVNFNEFNDLYYDNNNQYAINPDNNTNPSPINTYDNTMKTPRRRHRTNKQISRHHRNRYRRSTQKLINNIKDSNTYITNLSSKPLTITQRRVLSLGLKFVPTLPTRNNTLQESLLNFQRSNRLKYFFRNHPHKEQHPFRQKSTWQPPRASAEVEQYLERTTQSISTLPHKNIYQNLTKLELQALRELATDDSLVIKNADKGSGIVVEDRENYIKDGLQHLSDEDIYEKTDSDPTLPLAEGINEYVIRMHSKGIIDDTTKNYLTFKENNMPRTQQLYFLKKIHKNPIAVRPIVSGCGGPTEKISQFIDMHLQPLVPTINSYVKDSGHIIKILEQTEIPTNCTLATIDVKALYLNIPHKEGIEAVTNRLYKKNPLALEVPLPPGTMSDLLKIVLTKNYFQFVDQMYHQIQGTAMGTKMAPAYANLFMAELEEKLLNSYPTKPLIWKRYIDDVFCVWPGPPEDLKRFIDFLNEAHPTIKFTYECSDTSIDFLDLTLYRGERYKTHKILDIKPFFKKTNKFQYLEYSSAHPKKTFSSLIKGELTRLLRACSNEKDYKQVIKKMHQAFRDRGYPESLINKMENSVPFTNRPNIIQQATKQQCQYDTFLIIQYTPDLDINSIRSTLKPTITEKDHILKPCLSLKRSNTIGKKLVRAKLKNANDPPQSKDKITIYTTPELTGNSGGCGTPNCKCCKAMSRKYRIISTYNGKAFPTPTNTNCHSQNIIYLIECTKCNKRNQYVGQTQRTMTRRLAGHRTARRFKTNLPLYKHFANSPNHDFVRDTKVTILEMTTQEHLDNREKHWINTLETVYPKGLNSRFE